MSETERGLLKDFWGPGMTVSPEHKKVRTDVPPAGGDTVLTKWRYSAFFNDSQPFLVGDAITDFLLAYHRLALTYAAERTAMTVTTKSVLETLCPGTGGGAMTPQDALGRVLAADPPPFALLRRPEAAGAGNIDVLIGESGQAEVLAELPTSGTAVRPGTGRADHEVLAVVPYRQLAERGFAAADDGAPLITRADARHRAVGRPVPVGERRGRGAADAAACRRAALPSPERAGGKPFDNDD
jgi:hypothetical protein